VRFSAPIPRAQAEAIRITLPDGKALTPIFSDEEKRKATIADIKFKAPLPRRGHRQADAPRQRHRRERPQTLQCRALPARRALRRGAAAGEVRRGFRHPRSAEGGVLPVTVRNVEPSSAASRWRSADRASRSRAATARSPNGCARSTMPPRPRATRSSAAKRRPDQPDRRHAPLTPATGKPFQVSLPGKGKDFEVVGIPLTKPGFYVVELASPRLGNALLGRNAPRYVAAGALVTNMSVHFKWGRDSRWSG
jgi:hypothetical protein